MKSSYRHIVFTRPGHAELQEMPPGRIASACDDLLIETEVSIVSAGTELACLAGIEDWAPLPFIPGYGSVGRIVRRGTWDAGKDELKEGQRVLTFGKHAGLAKAASVVVPVPESLSSDEAAFARMASVSITALRTAEAQLGDYVAVIGLGLVGNLAAQLFSLAGCEVIGIDLSARRREQATACGIPHTLAPGDDLRERVAALTGGRLCSTVVEATGLSVVALNTAPQLCATEGEIVLLGSPRAAYTADVTPFLSQLHLCRPAATIKGALEWRYPVRETHTPGAPKHSIERNVRQLLRLLERGQLKVKPLLTHRASPADCASVYDGLAHRKDDYTGVLFDWSLV